MADVVQSLLRAADFQSARLAIAKIELVGELVEKLDTRAAEPAENLGRPVDVAWVARPMETPKPGEEV